MTEKKSPPKPLDAISTMGKLFRVRDKAGADSGFKVWGENMSYADAWALKNKVVNGRKSTTARVEEMPRYGGAGANPDDAEAMNIALGQAGRYVEPTIDNSAREVANIGVTTFNAPSADPALEAARQKAVAAAAPQAAAAQARNAVKMADPPKPPPSPLTDDVVDDLPDIPENLEEILESSDVQELVAEVGGGPADSDKQRAAQQAELDESEQMLLAQNAYESAVRQDRHPDTWPAWSELGRFETAAWRYYALNGGHKPALTRTMREPKPAMLTPTSEGAP